MKTASSKNIVFLGDSLTEYFDWQRRFPSHTVVNLGIAGEPVEGLHARLNRVHATVSDPDLIFIMTGINNVALEDYGFLELYRDILADIRSRYKKTVTVVQSVLPVILPWIEIETIEKVNESLAEMARQSHMEYLDIYNLFLDRAGQPIQKYLLDDGVHLSDRGYEVWAKRVEEYLARRS